MKTCACCGQLARSADRPTVRVDDDLLVLCNRAYEEAERRRAGEVEIAHVVWCMTIAAGAGAWFEKARVSRAELGIAVDRWLARMPIRSTAHSPQTSAELKALLSRAQDVAHRDRREFAAPADLLTALSSHSADLPTAAFTRGRTEREGLGHAAGPRAERSTPRPVPAEPQLIPPGGKIDLWPCPLGEAATAARRERRSESSDPHCGSELSLMGIRTRAEPKPRPSPIEMRGARWVQGELPLVRSSRARFEEDRDVWADDADLHRKKPAPASKGDGDDPHSDQLRPRAAATNDAGREILLDRLEQQEQEVAELRSLIARLLARQRRGEAAADAQQTEADDPDDHANDDGADQPQGWRSRLRVRAVQPATDHASSRSKPSRPAARSTPQAPEPAPRGPRRAPSPDTRARSRLVRDLGSELVEPMMAVPDNDIDDDADGAGDRMKRFYLSPDDDIIKAPSIGPRTAARLNPAGLVLVRDLLACDPVEVAQRVATRYMTAERIADWKAQARLVCTIPWLRGTHAQLLVGASYDTLAKLMRADASAVCSAVLRFAATREGQSILRSGPPPEIDRIACWIENTAMAEPARAA